jgi:hypothetical protein
MQAAFLSESHVRGHDVNVVKSGNRTDGLVQEGTPTARM